MTLNTLIFSNELKHRLARHLAFWLIFSLHFVIQNLMIGGPGEAKTSRTFMQSFFHFLYFLPVYLLATYLFIQVLLPRFFFRRKYAVFFTSFLLLFAVQFIAIYYAGLLYINQTTGVPFRQITFNANKYHAIVDGMFVPFMLLGIAAGIKFSKKWFLQQRENEKLSRQKLATELQLLKTSIHPRFLFHSLHTVEKNIDNSSVESPALILKLSDLLSYILYENEQNWVPLEKELEIIRCYINLEEKSYEEKLLFKTEFPENTTGKYIVPFLLLSIIENCFEYFFETAQEEPLLTLTIRINENVLHFQLFFSRSFNEITETGFPDEKFLFLQKQLQNQYPGLHHVEISSNAERISIDLKLPLYSGDLIDIKKHVTVNEERAIV